VVDLKIGDDAYIAGMRRADELTEIGEPSIVGMNVAITADIVTVVKSRRRIEGQEPYGVHAEIGNVVEF
jgi:acyl-[acyl carrier protein]--UDP-N-acetylglucosamine O-acyltransferase